MPQCGQHELARDHGGHHDLLCRDLSLSCQVTATLNIKYLGKDKFRFNFLFSRQATVRAKMELFINKYFQSSGLHTNRDIYCGAYVNFLVIFNFLLSISDE